MSDQKRLQAMIDRDDEDALEQMVTNSEFANEEKTMALLCAVQGGSLKCVKMLINIGVPINGSGRLMAETPLMRAAMGGHNEIIEYLLQADADVNLSGLMDGQTPLHAAAQIGHMESIECLLKANNINKNAQDFLGLTPLMIAIYRGKYKSIRALLGGGCDPFVTCSSGLTALHHTVSPYLNYVDHIYVRLCLQEFLRARIFPDPLDCRSRTPLYYAILTDNIAAVKQLVKANCNLRFVCRKNGAFESSSDLNIPFSAFAISGYCLNQRACKITHAAGSYMTKSCWNEVVAVVRNDSNFFKWLLPFLSNPYSLKQWSRVSIRQQLGYYPQDRIAQLGLPPLLENFLLLTELDCI